MSKELKTKCCICGSEINGYGNNPYPFKGDSCCNECNFNYVIPLRIYQINKQPNSAILFKTNGEVTTIKPKNTWFTLDELQALVGGYIELYPTRYLQNLVVCNEEGLIKRLPKNEIFKSLTNIDLVGDVLLVPEEIFEEPDNDE
jgi:hypothetical protein